MFLNRTSVSQSVRQSCFSCQRNSSETTQQNVVKLCSYEGHNVYMCIFTGNLIHFFSRNNAHFELQKFDQKESPTVLFVLSAQLL